MKKIEELSKNIENMRRELIKLGKNDERVWKIVEVLDFFYISEKKNGMIDIYFTSGSIPIVGLFKEDDMLYAFVLMDFYCTLYYKCKKIIRRIRKKEYRIKIDELLFNMGKLIRKQVLYNIKSNENFQGEQFYKEFKKFIDITIKALGHIVDDIGDLTSTYNPVKANKLKNIRNIYEKVRFQDDTITYIDCITKNSQTACIHDTVKFQYAVMSIYVKAYTESILWLKKYDSSGQWCPLTPWQTILNFKMLIETYFLY